jgi:hypothetical protein
VADIDQSAAELSRFSAAGIAHHVYVGFDYSKVFSLLTKSA